MFLKNKNIIFKIRRSKVTDYAALSISVRLPYEISNNVIGATSKASDQPEHTRVA